MMIRKSIILGVLLAVCLVNASECSSPNQLISTMTWCINSKALDNINYLTPNWESEENQAWGLAQCGEQAYNDPECGDEFTFKINTCLCVLAGQTCQQLPGVDIDWYGCAGPAVPATTEAPEGECSSTNQLISEDMYCLNVAQAFDIVYPVAEDGQTYVELEVGLAICGDLVSQAPECSDEFVFKYYLCMCVPAGQTCTQLPDPTQSFDVNYYGCAGPAVPDTTTTLAPDCFGVNGGDAVEDECGECGGDGSSCADCMGVPNGSAEEDDCGVCDGHNSDMDDCGECFGDGSSCADCLGVPNGSAEVDECGVCDGDNSCIDCAGTPNGDAVEDVCGVCNGDNSSCTGGDKWCTQYGDVCSWPILYDGVMYTGADLCVGSDVDYYAPNGWCSTSTGENYIYAGNWGFCNLCSDFATTEEPTTTETPDCMGVPGGSAVEDDCGVCDGHNSDMDDCGECFGDGSSCAMHAPSCCTCVEAEHPSWGTVPAQCSGDQQYAEYAPFCYMADDDACTAKMASGSIPGAFWGYCVEDVDEEANCEIDCAGVVGGSSEVDECGVCGGDGSSCATTTAEPTTTEAPACTDFTSKKPCKKEAPDGCVWNKHIGICHPDGEWEPNCPDYHGEKKICKKVGCTWNKTTNECMPPEPPVCSDYHGDKAMCNKSGCDWNKHVEMCYEQGAEQEVDCPSFNGDKSTCTKIGGCLWDKHSSTCYPEGGSVEVVCSDHHGDKSMCKKVGGCVWDKFTELCSTEGEIVEPECFDMWGEVAELQKTDGKIKHKGIFSTDDCIAKADEIGAQGIIYDLVSSKGLCYTFATAGQFVGGVSPDADEVIYILTCVAE